MGQLNLLKQTRELMAEQDDVQTLELLSGIPSWAEVKAG
jgi:hypothetical protein